MSKEELREIETEKKRYERDVYRRFARLPDYFEEEMGEDCNPED